MVSQTGWRNVEVVIYNILNLDELDSQFQDRHGVYVKPSSRYMQYL